MKVCKTCNIEKDISEFPKHKKYKDGLYSSCKSCKNESSKGYYLNNKEKVCDSVKLYRENNLEYYRCLQRMRRALKVSVGESYNAEDERFTRELFDHKCIVCGKTSDLTIDHLYPLSRGYALTRDNAVVLCRSCNSSKLKKLPEDFFSPEVFAFIKDILKLEKVGV